MTLWRRVALALVVAWALCLPAAAGAADRIYVANEEGSSNPLVSFANLDGSGGGNLPVSQAPTDYADGVAIDAAAGRLYFGRNSSSGGDRISFVNLDGSGGGDLTTPGVTVDFPNGLAIDPAAGKLYWSNFGASKIAFARLDGTAAGTLDTTGAAVSGPIGVAIDPARGKIYWANNSGGNNKISFANLDGSGGGDNLDTTGVTNNSAWGIALDVAAGRAYFGNGNLISFACLDGSGGDDLPTTGATLSSASGPAIDVPSGRIYWADSSLDTISFAALDGSGGATLATAGASLGAPSLPALLKRPSGAGIPVIAGGSVTGTALSCSQGTWAPDLLGAFLYRAPAGFAFKWSRDGRTVPGATTSSLTASDPGDYRCTVTASNAAGSASQTSPAQRVSLPAFGASTLVTLKLAAGRIPARGPLKVRVTNKNGFAITGRLSGQTVNRVRISRKRRVKLKTKAFRVAAQARKTVKLRLPKVLRRLLKRKHRLKLRLTAKLKDPAGNTRTIKKRVSPKLKRKRRR